MNDYLVEGAYAAIGLETRFDLELMGPIQDSNPVFDSVFVLAGLSETAYFTLDTW